MIAARIRTDGSLWVSIDDDEMPYLRVIMDEICGCGNFVASNVWQKRYSRENREAIGDVHEYIVLYAKDILDEVEDASASLLIVEPSVMEDDPDEWKYLSAFAARVLVPEGRLLAYCNPDLLPRVPRPSCAKAAFAWSKGQVCDSYT